YYHDRDILGCLLCRQRAGHIQRHDHIDLEPDKLGRELWKSIQLSFRGAKLECDVLPLYVAEFTQSFPELVLERLRVSGSYVECAYSRHLGLLPARRERPGSRAAEQRDELAPLQLCGHSITSSALASNVAGISIPIALAVLRLITSSYLVGACTGRLAGFSPLRIRST